MIMLNPNSGIKVKESKKSKTYEVISNSNLATFIKELRIKPVEAENIEFTPGDYMQLEIPKYQLSFKEIEIKDKFKKVWKNKGLLKLSSENESKITNEDRGPLDLTLLTEQYRADLKKYQDRESMYINTENKLKSAQQIAIEMATRVAKLDRRNEELMKEIDRLNEEIQLLEMQIKK